jgi:hypothetical protein
VQHTLQTPLPNLVGNRSSSYEGHALADTTPSTGFPVQYDEPNDRRTYEFLPPGDKGYRGIVSEISGSTLPGDIHYDTIEPSYLPQGVGMLSQQVQNKPGTHYDFNSLSAYDSKPGITQIDQSLQLNWSSGPSCASEPPFQELFYHSDIREAASALLTKSYEGSANWPMYLSQHDHSPPKPNSYLHSRSDPITPDREIPPKSEDRSLDEAKKVDKASHESGLHQHEQESESQNWAVQEELPSVAIQYQKPIPPDTKNASLVVSVRLVDQNIEPYPSEEDVFDKSDDEMGLDESDRDTQADFGKTHEDHLQNNDLGIAVALQASQDMQEQRLRTYHSFLDGPNILTSYQPSARSSPLNDSTAARIFYHYVNVTGPSISLYERHPANPSLMFQGRPIPRSQQHIWACKRIYLFLIAFANPSSRHYAYACPEQPGPSACYAGHRQSSYRLAPRWPKMAGAETLSYSYSLCCEKCQTSHAARSAKYSSSYSVTRLVRTYVWRTSAMEQSSIWSHTTFKGD